MIRNLTFLTLLFVGGACSGASDFGGSGTDAGTDASLGGGEDNPPDLDAAADAASTGSNDGGMLDAGLASDAGVDDAGITDAGELNLTVFSQDFEGTLPAGFDPGTGALTPTQMFAPLGPVGNQFGASFLRSQTANVVTLTLTDLPAHSSLSLELLFAAIDSLDGTGTFPAGDFLRITLDDVTIFRESFANAIDTQEQTYMPNEGVVLARRVDLGFAGPGGYYTDSAYDLGADPTFANLPHTASTAVLTFVLEGEGVQDINDESWAIDNVRVILGNTPR